VGKIVKKYNWGKYKKIVPIAEEMYCIQGKQMAEIADVLKIEVSNLYRWSKKYNWNAQKQLHSDVFRNTLLALEAQLEKFGEEIKDLSLHDESFSSKCDALSKLLGQIIKLRGHYDQDILKQTVTVMHEFAVFIRKRNMSDKQQDEIEEVTGEFFKYMRERYAQ